MKQYHFHFFILVIETTSSGLGLYSGRGMKIYLPIKEVNQMILEMISFLRNRFLKYKILRMEQVSNQINAF